MTLTIKELRNQRLQYLETTIDANVKCNVEIALEAIRKKVSTLAYGEDLFVILAGRNVSINLEDPIAMDWVDSEPEFADSSNQIKNLFATELVHVLASEGMMQIGIFELQEIVEPAKISNFDLAWSI